MSNVTVLEHNEPLPVTNSVLTPMEMINTALTNGAGVETIERLMSLQERWEANHARKAFNEAIASVRGSIPAIIKNRDVDFTTAKGRTNYKFEDFSEIARTVDPILNKHGLSYRFRAEQNAQRLRVTCILSHAAGYFEETSLEAPEDHSGNKNSIQAIGSSATYLQRYTLKLALGLSTSRDTDGIPPAAPAINGEAVTLDIDALKAEGKRIAHEEGSTSLGLWWTKELTKEQRTALGQTVLNDLKAIAMEGGQ